MTNEQQIFYKFLGENIRNTRNIRGIILEDLIKDIGLNITKATLSSMENGKQQISSYQLFKLASILNISIDKIFDEIKTNQNEESLSDNQVEHLIKNYVQPNK